MENTLNSVSCDAATAIGKVCSHAVTRADLLGWGIFVGSEIAHAEIPGPAFHVGVHEAWKRGLVHTCTLDPRSLTREYIPAQTPESIADALAWIATHRAAA